MLLLLLHAGLHIKAWRPQYGGYMNERLHMRAQIQVTTAAGSMVQVDCDNCWAVRLVLQACSQATFEEQSKVAATQLPTFTKGAASCMGAGPMSS